VSPFDPTTGFSRSIRHATMENDDPMPHSFVISADELERLRKIEEAAGAAFDWRDASTPYGREQLAKSWQLLRELLRA